MNTNLDWTSARETRRPRLEPQDLAALYERSDLRAGLYVGATALAIAALLGTALLRPPLVVLVAIFALIGALQHHLSIIHHEAVHYLLFRSRFLNELIGTIAASAIGFTMAYRTHHLLHHRHLGQAKDPDLDAYAPYPVSRAGLITDILAHLCGAAALVQFVRQSQRARAATKTGGATAPLQLIGIALTQLFLLACFALLGRPELYFWLWLLPLLTVAKTLTHIRGVVEHTLSPAPGGGSTRFRTIRCGRLERFLFAPMSFNFHAEHHFYPAIPYHNLERAHALLARDPVYRDLVQVRRSYLGFLLSEAVSPPLARHAPDDGRGVAAAAHDLPSADQGR